MGFDYLKGLNWKDVTRDERYFCAELFFEIKKDVPAFVKWLQQNKVVDISANELQSQWEIGFEVCFYRDYIIKYGDENGNTSIKKTSYSQKRTFDLCLFSEKHIVIIEAKAQQGFESKQNEEFREDIEKMMRILKKKTGDLKVVVVALASSIYYSNVNKYSGGLPAVFEGRHFSWLQMFDLYKNDILKKADETYA